MDFAIGGSLKKIHPDSPDSIPKMNPIPMMPERPAARYTRVGGGLVARNALLNMIGLGLPLIVGLLTIPVIVRSLGTQRFGILSLIWVVFGYFGFLDLGLGRATTKFAAEALGRGEIENIPKFLWTTVSFQIVLGFVGAILLSVSTPLLVERILNIPPAFVDEARTTFYWIAWAIPLTILSTSFRGILEAAQRFDLVNAVKIPASAAFYLFPLIGILLGFNLPGIVALLVLSRFLSLLGWAVLSARVFPVLKKRIVFQKDAIGPLLRFGGWVTLSAVIWPILSSIDRFFIGARMTIESVSFYSAPYEVVMRLGIIPGSLALTLFPAFSALGGSGEFERTRTLYGRSVKFLLVMSALVAVPLFLFAGPVLKIWLGAKFAEQSTVVFQVLLIGFLCNSLSSVPFGLLQGIGRADLPTKVQLAELVVYVPLLWVMIRWLGIVGAALAWTLRVVAEMLVLFLLARKAGKMEASAGMADGLIRASAVVLGFAAAGYFVSRWTSQLVWPVFLCVGFLGAIGFYVLDPADRAWIFSRARVLLSNRGRVL
jgi:O-antigen/teichoic acid export membrane protein